MAKNLGRLRTTISGITGVSAGSVAVVNLPVNQRYHRLQLNCSGVNYTGGVAIVPTIVTAGGFTNTTGTCRLNCVNGVPTSVTYVAGNSAGATTATVLSVPDSTGMSSIILTCTAAGTGVLGNATFAISGATAGPIQPATLITSLRLSVNGVVMRDISPAQILAIMTACGYFPQFGSLPIWFTEPTRNFLRDNELTSWDLFGQSTFQIQIGISANVTTPGLTGLMEFDYNRNARAGNAAQTAAAIAAGAIAKGAPVGTPIPFAQPVSQHSFTIPISSGRFDITTLPHNKPISRLWLSGSSYGNLTQVEILQDGNLVYQASAQQMFEDASEYGYQLGNPYVAAAGGGGYGGGVNGFATAQVATSIPNGVLSGSPWLYGAGGGSLYPLDGAVIFDLDNRPWKALRVDNALVLRVYSNAAQNLTVIQETLPGAFSG